jgi:hypothetical protein
MVHARRVRSAFLAHAVAAALLALALLPPARAAEPDAANPAAADASRPLRVADLAELPKLLDQGEDLLKHPPLAAAAAQLLTNAEFGAMKRELTLVGAWRRGNGYLYSGRCKPRECGTSTAWFFVREQDGALFICQVERKGLAARQAWSYWWGDEIPFARLSELMGSLFPGAH